MTLWMVGLGVLVMSLVACLLVVCWAIGALLAEHRRAWFQREVYGDQYARERLDRLARMPGNQVRL